MRSHAQNALLHSIEHSDIGLINSAGQIDCRLIAQMR
jgi:hypothetical protein